MKNSWLIQRLQSSFEDTDTPLSKLLGVFSFGGEFVNGGLSKEAMDLLSPIFSFDYMGAAEYEWGVVPETLNKIAKNIKNYVPKKIDVSYKYHEYSFLPESKEGTKLGKDIIYVLCLKDDFNEIKDRISKWAIGLGLGETRDYIGLDKSLAFPDKTRVKGWLELDNGFLFFTDKEMFEKLCCLFEIKIDNIGL